MAFEEYWNSTHQKYGNGKPIYDKWLDKYLELFKNVKTPILDLGSGTGNDTLYLIEKGFNVIACDYSKQALEIINKYIPTVQTKLVDISKKLPFNDDEFEIILADLSLHYFDNETTLEIMKEIRRILKKDGYLLARVNSVKDINHGAGQGQKIEENFYFVEGYNKRFFSLEDVNNYFSIIGKVEAKEAEMLRYEKPKKLIEIKVQK